MVLVDNSQKRAVVNMVGMCVLVFCLVSAILWPADPVPGGMVMKGFSIFAISGGLGLFVPLILLYWDDWRRLCEGGGD